MGYIHDAPGGRVLTHVEPAKQVAGARGSRDQADPLPRLQSYDEPIVNDRSSRGFLSCLCEGVLRTDAEAELARAVTLVSPVRHRDCPAVEC
jgi:hypothetical protein